MPSVSFCSYNRNYFADGYLEYASKNILPFIYVICIFHDLPLLPGQRNRINIGCSECLPKLPFFLS